MENQLLHQILSIVKNLDEKQTKFEAKLDAFDDRQTKFEETQYDLKKCYYEVKDSLDTLYTAYEEQKAIILRMEHEFSDKFAILFDMLEINKQEHTVFDNRLSNLERLLNVKEA